MLSPCFLHIPLVPGPPTTPGPPSFLRNLLLPTGTTGMERGAGWPVDACRDCHLDGAASSSLLREARAQSPCAVASVAVASPEVTGTRMRHWACQDTVCKILNLNKVSRW